MRPVRQRPHESAQTVHNRDYAPRRGTVSTTIAVMSVVGSARIVRVGGVRAATEATGRGNAPRTVPLFESIHPESP